MINDFIYKNPLQIEHFQLIVYKDIYTNLDVLDKNQKSS